LFSVPTADRVDWTAAVAEFAVAAVASAAIELAVGEFVPVAGE
jgi:hypothetical protein